MCDNICEDVSKLKEYIIGSGFYDDGMSIDDMKQMYKTLNRSKQTANSENEYHELLSQTDLNCSNLASLQTELSDIDDPNTNKPVIIASFASTPEKSTQNNSRSRKLPKRVAKSDIDFNFSSTSNNKPVVSITQKRNICPLLYHHPKVLKLPVKDRAEVILLYLKNQLEQIRTDEIKPPVSWCKPIVPHPKIKFNNDLSVEAEAEFEFEENTKIENSESTSQDYIVLKKSKRLVKRKNYGEVDSDEETINRKINYKKTKPNNTIDKNITLEKINELPSTSSKSYSQKEDSDEDFCPTKSKKSKTNDNSGTVVVNKSTPVPKPIETTTSKAKKWLPKIPKLFTGGVLDVTDRTNKLFDKLKEDDNTKKPKATVKLDDISDLSDNDDIFPSTTTTTNVNIHNETTPKLKKGKATVTKKTPAKSRKKLNLKTTSEENNTAQIPATNFYGKNKENELDASNNNKSTTSKMTQCPICNRSFPNSEIEAHAALCDQFEESPAESLCVICNKYFPNADLDAHKFICLRTLTESSTEKTYDKCKNNSNLGFLCEICDKFVVDCKEYEHASNCIGIAND